MVLDWMEHLVDTVFATIPRAKPSSHAANQALLIAHRGDFNNLDVFENTRSAFQRAKDLGCWGIEFDVHTTADGVFVVNHDPDLRRLWQHDVAIADLSAQELRRLVPELPTLTEVVAEFSEAMHLFIELKAPVTNQPALLASLGSCEPLKDYHLLSLESSFYETLDQFPKQALLLVAGHNNMAHFCELSIAKNYGGVLGNYLLLTQKRHKQLRQAQQAAGVGFVNSKNSLYRELNREMTWLFTNEAPRVTVCLNALK